MLVLTCQCGHQMTVPEDTIGRTRTCSKCRKPVKATRDNTTPAGQRLVRPGRVMSMGAALTKRPIGELLIQQELISEAQLKEALKIQKEQGGKIVEILISMGVLSVEAFVRFLARQPGVASIDLSHYEISPELVDLVPKEIAVKHEVFPIDRIGRLLTLGMVCPLDSSTIAQIEESTGLRVKALLCAPEDIRSAIRRYYPPDKAKPIEELTEAKPAQEESGKESVWNAASKAETGLKLSRVSRLVKEIKTLPALPATVAKVQEAAGDLSVAPKDVAGIIKQDPPIAAKVLSVANSAAYGFPNKVDSVELAVALMGLRETYTIVLSAAVINLFDQSKKFNYQAYWEEAMNCAAASRILAQASGHKRHESLFTAGLLHDIGRIALLETVPELYKNVSPQLTGDELIKAEQEVVGLTHTEAGYELASNWSLPADLYEPIRFHHQPEFAQEHPEVVALVALAESWTRSFNLEQTEKEEKLTAGRDLCAVVNLDEASASEAFDEVTKLEPAHFEWA